MTVQLITPKFFADSRGWFVESWTRRRSAEYGITSDFCQDNHSLSRQAGTIRGLHFQREPYAQAKLVRCIKGRIFDVAVDIRKASPTFGQWLGVELTPTGGEQLFIPAGYAHGFLTLEDDTEVAYKVDAYYAPEADGGIAWNDSSIGIDWPLNGMTPLLSDKDNSLPMLKDADVDFVYDGIPLRSLDKSQ
jgi:dTDP-4-dehydrorhamnose 3,5-epimerase